MSDTLTGPDIRNDAPRTGVDEGRQLTLARALVTDQLKNSGRGALRYR